MKLRLCRNASRMGWALALLSAVSAASLATAQTPETARVLTINQALERALTDNPGLIGNAYQLEAQTARTQGAAIAPTPTVRVSVENVLGSGSFDGFNAAETTLGLSWVLEGERRRARVVSSSTLARTLEAQGRIDRVEVAATTVWRFIEALVAQELLDQTLGRLQSETEAVEVLARQAEKGLTPEAVVQLARLDLARAHLAVDDAQHELTVANHTLAAQWGQTVPDFARVAGVLEPLPSPAPFEVLLTSVTASPHLAGYATQRRVVDANLRLAETQREPLWQLNANLRHFAASDDVAVVAGFNVTLPSEQRYNARRAELRAEKRRLDADETARVTEMKTTLFAQYSALQHSRHVYEQLSDVMLPAAETALKGAMAAYRTGGFPYSEIRRVRQEYWVLRREQLAAAANAHRLYTDIERLTGVVVPHAEPEDL